MKKQQKKKGSSFGDFFSVWRGRLVSFRKRMNQMKVKKQLSFDKASLPKLSNAGKMSVDLTPMSIAKGGVLVIFALILFYFFYDVRGILLIFFISFLFAAALDPLIDRLARVGVPRALGIILIYIVVFVLIALFVSNIVTLVADQVIAIAGSVGEFVSHFGADSLNGFPFADQIQPYLNQIFATIDLQTAASQIQNALQIVSAQLYSLSIGLFNLLLIFILTFFMTVEEKGIEEFFRSLFPARYSQYITTRMNAIKDQVGLWLRGQLLVSVIAGILSYIGLVIMGVEYALTLSLVSAITMVIPVFGRFFAWMVTFPIVFNQFPALSVWMSIYYFVLMQLENNILVPYIMNKAVGLSPIVIIFAMMVGQQYLGLLGLVLSIPIATTVSIFVKDYTSLEK